MITNDELVQTIRYASGVSHRAAQDDIDAAAERLGLTSVQVEFWHDDDADEICLEVERTLHA